ncbi:HNH endonuclease family protein [Nocardioides taihuensis]|uniref:HNH endonuclease family protein n=1 Tax=Nocardioides taihuensis TaxID=1835606 RepID=A0ABW0BNK4_9ACTN
MRGPRVLLGAVLAAALTVTGALALPAPADAGTSYHHLLRWAVRHLPVADETRAGYDRDKFVHWIDADGDCQDTRDEVLDAESLEAVSGCDIQRGRWFSTYDRVTVRRSTNLDIDHMVALAEAWDSGAKQWKPRTRKRFANDLGDRRSLAAVTASSNRSKGDSDPAEWLPEFGTCAYVRHWVAVKVRWQLTVDDTERTTLRRLARGCDNDVIRVERVRTP